MTTLAKIYKRASVYASAPCPETTIIVAPDGRLVTLTFWYKEPAAKIIIRDFWAGSTIAEAPLAQLRTGGGTAIVANGQVHVFCALPFVGTAAQIVKATFDANWNLSSPEVIHTAVAPNNPCNLGICASPLGYVISVETQQVGQVYFLRSADLATWTPIGTPMSTGVYLGSPKIYWSQRRGCFFLTYLVNSDGKFHTAVAKFAPDLNGFQVAPNYLLSPDGQGETGNTSDMTLVEVDGITHLVYLDGNQTAYTNYRAAVYLGPLEQLWEEFFPFVPVVVEPVPETGNVIPQMTGPTTGGVVISASSQYFNNAFLPWHAADRNQASCWHSSGTTAYPHRWRIDFPAAKTISSYAIKCRDGQAGQAPKNFRLETLVNGSWVAADTQADITGYQVGVFKEFTLQAPVTATSFSIVTTANVEASANLSFSEIELRA